MNGIITVAEMTNAFTFTSETGGYTIKQSDNRFWYQTGTYNNFNVSASPTSGQYFTFAKNADGTFKVTNVAMSKYLQYNVSKTSYGCYSDAQGVMPYLYEYIGYNGGTPTYSITIASGIQNGTVTASMTSNIEQDESITITVTPATGYELETLTVDGADVTSQVVNNEYNFDMPGHDVTVNATFKSTGTTTYDFTTVAELNALVTTTSATYNGKFTNAVISFVPATSTAIIKDATGSITYYKSSHGLKQGQTFSGDITVTAVNFTGNNGTTPLYSEITDLGSAKFTGAEAVVAPENVTLSALIGHYADYQNAYVKVSDLTVVSKSGKNITVTDGTNTYIVFDNTNGISCKADDKITAAGTVTKYGTTEEIKVWAAADATVTSTGTGGGDVYTLYSGALTEGDYLITYSDRAMNTEIANNRLQFVTVAPKDNKVTSSDATIVWHIAKSGNYWTIYNAGVQKYAAGNGTKNQATLLASGTDDGSLWTVTVTDDGTYEFVNKKNAAASVNCNLRNNGTYGFACYGTGTGGALTLYKLN